MFNYFKKNDDGFTLIELLVVVIIIGILAAIAIPVFLNQRDSARRAAVESDVRNGAIQVETYYTQNSDYPATAADMTNLQSSDGVALLYTNDGDGTYIIEGCNTFSSDINSSYFQYDSAAGGIVQDATGTCPTNVGWN